MTETEVACLERGEAVGLAELGLRLDEAKQLTAAFQAQIVPAQVAMTSERHRWCGAWGRGLASKGVDLRRESGELSHGFCQGSRQQE